MKFFLKNLKLFGLLVYRFTIVFFLCFIHSVIWLICLTNSNSFGLQVYRFTIVTFLSLINLVDINKLSNFNSFWFTGLQVYDSHIFKLHLVGLYKKFVQEFKLFGLQVYNWYTLIPIFMLHSLNKWLICLTNSKKNWFTGLQDYKCHIYKHH